MRRSRVDSKYRRSSVNPIITEKSTDIICIDQLIQDLLFVYIYQHIVCIWERALRD